MKPFITFRICLLFILGLFTSSLVQGQIDACPVAAIAIPAHHIAIVQARQRLPLQAQEAESILPVRV